MPKDKTRREIEALRAQMDAISEKSKKHIGKDQPTGKIPEAYSTDSSNVFSESKNQEDLETGIDDSDGKTRQTATAEGQETTSRFLLPSAGQFLPGVVIFAVTLALLIAGRHAVFHRKCGRTRDDGQFAQSKLFCHHPVANFLGHDLGYCWHGFVCPDHRHR